jgi:hypothetical protein
MCSVVSAVDKRANAELKSGITSSIIPTAMRCGPQPRGVMSPYPTVVPVVVAK